VEVGSDRLDRGAGADVGAVPDLLEARLLAAAPQLWWVFGVHCARIVTGSLLVAIAWHFAMPNVSIGVWLMMAAARLLVWRLPLVPNKEAAFAAISPSW
jgi:hypothetical protein